MSLHRYAAKRDANEPIVVEALEQCGWTVKRLSADGWPDLFCWKGYDDFAAGGTCSIIMRWVEVKQPKKKLRASQEWWAGVLPVTVLRSIDEVLAWNRNQ